MERKERAKLSSPPLFCYKLCPSIVAFAEGSEPLGISLHVFPHNRKLTLQNLNRN